MWIGKTVGQNQFEAQLLVSRFSSRLRRKSFVPVEVLPLADREINLYRIHGGYRGHLPASWIDQGTYLKLSLPGDAVDRRNQPGKIEVDLGRFDRGLGRLDLSYGRGHRSLGRQVVLNSVVQVLLTGGLLLRQRRVTVYVKFGPALHRLSIGQHGSRLRQLPLRLVERCLEGSRVNLKK